MDKWTVISRIKEEKLIAVVRAEDKKQCLDIIEAIGKGGIKIIEITMTVPGAVDIIKDMSKKYAGSDVVIGAGTVLDEETARMVILAGAKFVVSPMLSENVIRMCNRYKIAVIPGIMTVKEAVEALELGADILKIFPGNVYSPSVISAFKGPLPQADFMPTGGVDVDNAGEWIRSGAVAVGTGSSLTRGAKTGDYEAVMEKAKEFVEEVNKVR
ncbi:MAG: bifunctional 2-keto-4-hydroxyglutarate aldolase/2-keto-3-deoxy-6-phosphogluconate aldolase [Lachnospiraceae bacterium]